jgi:hypothetical protein
MVTALSAIFILLIYPSFVFSQDSVPPFLTTKVNGTNFDVLLDVPARYQWGLAEG